MKPKLLVVGALALAGAVLGTRSTDDPAQAASRMSPTELQLLERLQGVRFPSTRDDLVMVLGIPSRELSVPGVGPLLEWKPSPLSRVRAVFGDPQHVSRLRWLKLASFDICIPLNAAAIARSTEVHPVRDAAPTLATPAPGQTAPPVRSSVALAPPSQAPPSEAASRSERQIASSRGASLRIYFRNPVANGSVTVRVGSALVFERKLEGASDSISPTIDEVVPVSAGSSDLQVWVIASDRSVNAYQKMNASFPPGDSLTLVLELQPGGLSTALH